jgi:hypothetical protein
VPPDAGEDGIRVTPGEGNTLNLLVARPPEALPAVRPRDLEAAWDRARDAARAARFGAPLLLRFRRDDGSVTDLALTDQDASCWARAVDGGWRIDTLTGLAVCLRLLALIDLLGRARWAAPMVRFAPDGAWIDPALLSVAATEPLTRDAQFDEAQLQARLKAALPAARPVGDTA